MSLEATISEIKKIFEAGLFKPASDMDVSNRKGNIPEEQKARNAGGIYYFDELSDSAKDRALEHYRYNSVDYDDWWHDDYFFQPSDADLTKIGVPEGKMLFDVGKKVYFDIDRGSYLEIPDLDVNYSDCFMNWLGIPKRLRGKIYYKFGTSGYRSVDTQIEFEKDDGGSGDFSPWEQKFIDRAEQRFNDHRDLQLKHLRDDYEYRTNDEQVAENIRSNEYEFDEDGNNA